MSANFKLLTAANKKALPALYSQERTPDPLVVAKWFSPYSGWRWYAIEGEEQDGDWRFYGLVTGHVDELGYWTLADLDRKAGRLPLVERDAHWTPTPLSKIKSGEVV